MPRMQSSSSQCCLCSIGVFMFLFGIIMIATGSSLCLNYNILDDELLLPELRNDEGKQIVGIILICVGIVFAIVSVSVSAYYLCIHAYKRPSNITPDDMRSLSNGSTRSRVRHANTQRPNSCQSSRSSSNQNIRNPVQGARRKISPVELQKRSTEKPSGSKCSQSVPSVHHRSKHKKGAKKKSKRLLTKTPLEDIKELDTLSRYTTDVDNRSTPDNLDETPRSEDLDLASVNTSETSNQVPVYYVTDHSSIPGTAHSDSFNQDDSDKQNALLNKQTKHHPHTTDHNSRSEDDITSTGSDSTGTKNITGSDSTVTQTMINDDQSQTSSL